MHRSCRLHAESVAFRAQRIITMGLGAPQLRDFSVSINRANALLTLALAEKGQRWDMIVTPDKEEEEEKRKTFIIIIIIHYLCYHVLTRHGTPYACIHSLQSVTL